MTAQASAAPRRGPGGWWSGLLSALGLKGRADRARAPAPVAPVPAPAEPPPPALFTERRSGLAGGPLVMLVPGLSAPAETWDGLAAAFAPSREVRALHLAGMAGQPPAAWPGRYLEAHAEAIVARLAALGREDVTLIGHSMGATLAMMAAALAPQRISRLVVVDQAPFLAQWLSAGQVQTAAQAEAMAERTRRSFLEADWGAGPPGFDQRLAIETRDETFRPVVRDYLLRSDQATIAEAMADLLRTDLRQRLPLIAARTLVLMSYDPSLIPAPPQFILSAARLQYAGLPRGEIRLIEGARHWVMHDQPDATRAAIFAFLAAGD